MPSAAAGAGAQTQRSRLRRANAQRTSPWRVARRASPKMSLMTENGTGAADGDGLWLDPTDGEEEAVTPATGDDVGDTVLREEGGGKAGREAPGRRDRRMQESE